MFKNIWLLDWQCESGTRILCFPDT